MLAEYLTNYAIYTFRYISDELMLKKYAELIEDLAQNQDIKLMEINTSLYDEENDVPFKVSCNGFEIIIVEENLLKRVS